jgi:hypothetical protein
MPDASDLPPSAEAQPSPNAHLASFVVRFVSEAAPASGPARDWHGVIRHVQSDAERYFTRWSDAVAFIASYVQLESPPGA